MLWLKCKSNIRKGGKDMNVHWQIGLLLGGATFKRGKDTKMSKVG
jgi:hypothetical protein